MAHAAEMPGAGETGRPRADDQHPLAGLGAGGNGPALLGCPVAKEALDRVDQHRLVEVLAIAARLAGVIAGAAVHGGQRVVSDQRPPSGFEVAVAGEGQPRLNVLAGRAGGVAGRQVVDPCRPLPASRAGAFLHRRLQDRRQVLRYQAHTASASMTRAFFGVIGDATLIQVKCKSPVWRVNAPGSPAVTRRTDAGVRDRMGRDRPSSQHRRRSARPSPHRSPAR